MSILQDVRGVSKALDAWGTPVTVSLTVKPVHEACDRVVNRSGLSLMLKIQQTASGTMHGTAIVALWQLATPLLTCSIADGIFATATTAMVQCAAAIHPCPYQLGVSLSRTSCLQRCACLLPLSMIHLSSPHTTLGCIASCTMFLWPSLPPRTGPAICFAASPSCSRLK